MRLLCSQVSAPLFVFGLFAALSGCQCSDRIKVVEAYEDPPSLSRGGEPDNALGADAGQGPCDDQDGDGYGVGIGCLGPDCDDGDASFKNSGSRSCYTGAEGTAGVGACQRGVESCNDGVLSACAGETIPEAESCDSVDNDCDGTVDEEVTETCYTGAADTNGVGACMTGIRTCSAGSFGECTGEVVPTAESCDGVDNNCDGTADEAVVRSCYSGPAGTEGVGLCAAGTQTCDSGGFGACQGETLPSVEICDGLDNDCDGLVDESITRSCYTGPAGTANVGVCAAGTQTCSAGAWGTCAGETLPSAEACDNQDNDCDGAVDENVTRVCYGGPAGTSGVGVCTSGVQTCSAGSFGSCAGEVRPSAESCDNKDNDCDGTVDEALVRSCYSGPAGTSGVGACHGGSQTCSAGSYGACTGQVTPSTESCDNEDNDCDGTVDENVTRVCYGGPAGTSGVGACTSGVQTCTAGSFGSCAGEVRPSAEACDNLDNDCDGTTDESLVRSCYDGPGGTAGVGACRAGAQTCFAGSYGACTGEVTPVAESCDDVDNNCDGTVDELLVRSCYTGPAGTFGVGVCRAGSQVCSAGSYGTCAGQVTPSTETCDNLDNNCDGTIDESLVRSCYSGPAGTSGVGVCRAGSQTCSSGSYGACSGQVTPSAETCDNQDNDCNGAVDENVTRVCYGGPAGTAGVGVCTSGVQTCSAGSFGSCAGEVRPSAETCDNQDNDCNGAVDESLVRSCYSGPAGTSGVGVCHGGSQTCSAGVFGACTGQVTPSTESCDNLDNNCNGAVDESVVSACYSGPSGTLGVGICSSGAQTCTAGSYGACVGATVPAFEVCDGADNDCNGRVDENQTLIVRDRTQQSVILRPVDIIFVIDNSASMSQEITAVQNNINVNFADIMAQSGIDYRVIMISKHGSVSSDQSICVKSPLSGNGTCSTLSTCPVNGPRFFHYSTEIGSHNSLQRVIDTYSAPDACGRAPSGWKAWLRPNAQRVFIEITDDGPLTPVSSSNPDYQSADTFETKLFGLSSTNFGTSTSRNYIFHTIAGLRENVPATSAWPPTAALVTGLCTGNGGDVVQNGLEYQRLSVRTGGLRYPICQYQSFDAVFRAVATGIIESAQLACDFGVTVPADSAMSTVSLEFMPSSGPSATLTRVSGPAACSGMSFYTVGTQITLCPTACTQWQSDTSSQVGILFSCAP